MKMKRNAVLIFALLVCSLAFTSFSPSLDGRAVVAAAGALPKGIFAKTVGYLPGDSISVTNLANKATVDILVIGSIDPTEGVAILLSPEAASLLGLGAGSNAVVKITKRSGQLDESVSGTAVIGGAPESSAPAADVGVADALEDSVEEEESELAESADGASSGMALEVEEEVRVPEESRVEDVDALSEVGGEAKGGEAKTPPLPVAEEVRRPEESRVEDIDALSEIRAARLEAAESDVLDEAISPKEARTAEPLKDDGRKLERVYGEPLFEYGDAVARDAYGDIPDDAVRNAEKAASDGGAAESASLEGRDAEAVAADALDDFKDVGYKVASAAPPVKAVAEEEGVLEERVQVDSFSESEPPVPLAGEYVAADDIPEQEAPSASENVLADALSPLDEFCAADGREDAVAETPFDEEKDVNGPSALELCERDLLSEVPPPAPQESAEEAAFVPKEEEAKIEAVVLEEAVAAEDVAAIPKEAEASAELVPEEEVKGPANIVLVPVGPNPPESSERDVPQAEPEVPPKAAGDLSQYTVGNISELARGMYYVQIAVYSGEGSVRSVFERYGPSYPIVLVPSSSGKGIQVLVGPLNLDEYGAVLNRFRADGFKDAFLRKMR